MIGVWDLWLLIHTMIQAIKIDLLYQNRAISATGGNFSLFFKLPVTENVLHVMTHFFLAPLLRRGFFNIFEFQAHFRLFEILKQFLLQNSLN